MSDPDANHLGYAAAFQQYFDKGWRGILPLRYGSKWPPPKNYTGYGNPDPSYPDLMAWADGDVFRQGNLGLRLPDGVIGIDVDEYGAKNGASTFAEAIRRWGPLPDAPRTTSRPGNPFSGIRLFAVPLGTMLATKMEFTDGAHLGDVEIIQPHHRYAMSWPSIHPEGGLYEWRNDADVVIEIPALGDLPTLPSTWLEGLRVVHESNLEYEPSNVNIALTEGQPSTIVTARFNQAWQELNTPGCSRHDTATRHVMALMRYGKSGEPGVAPTLVQLCKVMINIRAADGTGTEESTKAEFKRMIYGDNLARELAKPGNTDWVGALITEEAQVDQRQPPENLQVDQRQPVVPPAENTTGTGLSTQSDNEGRVVEPTPTPALPPIHYIERGFWDSRESLAMIYQTALARMASPWAVLGICAARALTQVRPNVTLPPVVGGPGSLNWFLALVARSGGGKGAANAASNLLIPKGTFKQKTIGSGEGLVKLFDRPKNADPEQDVNEAILVNVDEVDTLTALSQRSASTTIAVLKQAFSGESLGFTYVNRANVRDVEDHGYRMTLVVSVQPRKSAGLFADEGGGLPQRFMWFPAGEKRIDMKQRWPSSQLTLPHPSEWLYPREIAIPAEAEYLIRYNRMMNAHEELEAIDGHALFCREKFAYALAILDGRSQMTIEDWQLSGIAAEVSDYTRARCLADLQEAAKVDAVERGEIRGVEMEAAEIAKAEQQIKRAQKVLNWLLHKLDSAPEGWLGQGELMAKCTSANRKVLAELLERGHQAIRGEFVDGTIRWARN